MSSSPNALLLRAAAVWGTTVVALRYLEPGQSLRVGDGADALVPTPDGSGIVELPVRAVGNGWELDARGATGGSLLLRGREEDPVRLAQSGAPIPIVAGDHGLLQYGNFSVFFQFAEAPPPMVTRRRPDWSFVLAFAFSTIAMLGGLAFIWRTETPLAIPKPLELTSAEELARQLNLDIEPVPVEEPNSKSDSGVKDPGKKDPKEQGGGKKMARAEGALGRSGKEEQTRVPGETPGLGGMAEALSSDVGAEVMKTLGTISSVADALGGLGSDSLVLGRSSGFGLKGGGPGGGGDGPGVPFGSGTLDTGWGPGTGGGFGPGSGGPGRAGLGGPGEGGNGKKGNGNGGGNDVGENRVTGKDAARSGQGLSPNQIQRVVMSRFGAFNACYESALGRDPTLQGTVRMSWTIEPGGSVAGAAVASSTMNNPRVEGCMLRQIQRLRFPTADKPTSTAFPFSFHPSKR